MIMQPLTWAFPGQAQPPALPLSYNKHTPRNFQPNSVVDAWGCQLLDLKL